jgi:hypothetical protein
MSNKPPDFDSIWQGLEPEQPRPRRGAFYIALAAAIFLSLGACVLGYYTLQNRAPLNGEPPLSLTTLPETTSATTQAEMTAEVNETTVVIAPTVTLPFDGATPPPSAPAEIVAARLSSPPIINGEGSDWAGLTVYRSPYVVFTHQEWDGTDDLNATWQIAGDETNLYLLANIEDDIHVQTQIGNTTFRGDSVELQIDTGRATDYRSSIGPDDFQISLSPGDFSSIPPSAWRFQGTANGQILDAPTPHSIIVAAQRSGNGYHLEAAIPWRDLNLTPSSGLILGLAVNFNDNDTPGGALQEMMKSSAPNRRFGDPTTWGTLRLE